MLWDNWNVYNGKPSFFGEPATTQTEQTADAAQSNDGADSVPQTVGSGSEAVAKGMIDAKRPVEVSNDMLKLTIDEVGGVVTHAVLLKEHQQSDWTEVGIAGMILGKEPAARPNIELLTVSPKSVYVAQSGFIGGDFPSSVDFKNYRYSEDDGVQSGTIELGYYMAETIKLTIR